MKEFIKKCQQSIMGERKILVDILAICFGMGAWVGVNGMFVQLPLLVNSAPEKWVLPSYMSITVQIANIGPISYAIARRFFPKKINDAYCIYCVLLIGFVAALLTSFLYDYTVIIGGKPRSAVFLVLVFFTALVGCTSSVLFYPFMGNFKNIYLTSYFIGEGLSGSIPSVVALIQGVGGNPECLVIPGNKTEVLYSEPLFGTEYYFIFIAVALAISFCGFVLLNHLTTCQSERVTGLTERFPEKELSYDMKHIGETDLTNHQEIYKFSDTVSTSSEEPVEKNKISTQRAASLLVLISIICAFGNGIFPSIQSYSCLPYGNTAYHLAVTLSSMANPIACFVAVFLPRTSNRSISLFTAVCSVFVAYVVTTSVMSPTPPLVHSVAGEVIVVLAWIFVVGLVSYIKLCISTVFRTEGGSWMFYCGGISQAGSAVGSLVSYFLIVYTTIFVQNNPCG